MQMNPIKKDFLFIHNFTVTKQEKVEIVSARNILSDGDLNVIAAKYPQIFCGRVTLMKGKPAKIKLSKDVTPPLTGHYRTIANA